VFERFTDRARRVVVLAQEEARLLDHNYIGTEHLLLGLIHEREGVAARTLVSLGVSLSAARSRVAEIIGSGGQAPSGHIPFTPRAKKVLELGLREALQLGHNHIGTEHILLGLIREGEGVAAQVLTGMGVELAQVRERVIQLASTERAEPQAVPLGSEATPGGIVPVRCGFCGLASPACGALFTGRTGALICERCIVAASGQVSRAGRVAEPGVFGIALGWEPTPVEELAAAHEPSGAPPEDEANARLEIEYAFRNSTERTADGADLVNVEGGESLGACQDQVVSRFGAIAARTQRLVDYIKFLNATEAVVWTTTLLDGRPITPDLQHTEGRAVLVDGKWKVARATMCAMFARAGVICPPPPEPTVA
jgi:hypothetical protein